MPTATHAAYRWRQLLILLSAAGFALSLSGPRAAAASLEPTVVLNGRIDGDDPALIADNTTVRRDPAAPELEDGSLLASNLPAAPASSGTLPGNDPSLFAGSVPTNTGPAVSGAAPGDPSTSFAINLLKRLVKRGILTQEDADDLTKQAQADAASARAAAHAEATAASQAVVSQVTEQAAAMTPPPPTEDEVRVPYVPEVVKNEMRDEIKADVLQQARDEHWANPRAIPAWVGSMRLFGDIRTRYDGTYFPNTNDNTGAFPNFNSINTGAPFDVAGTQFSPQYDVDQDRQRFPIRARVGIEADLLGGFTAGIRLGSGQDDSPVTGNQTLGLANGGQGGNFSKYSVWLDRAYLKYQYLDGGDPDKAFSIAVGRMDNPFFSTTLTWARDLGFDGITAQGRYHVARGFTPWLTAGAYPVFNTDFNFANNQPAKFQSEDKYLFAGQLGADWTITKDVNAKLAGALYYFENIEGHLSNPFVPLSASDQGNTDDSRPAFAQNGNTYFPIRDIVPTAQNDFGAIDQFQYYGLATPFHELDFTGQLNYDRWAPIRVSLIGEYVQNLAFNAGKIGAIAVNNRGAGKSETVTNASTGITSTVVVPGAFQGGNTAWLVTLKAGMASLEKLWDWNIDVGYRYVESDALVDGFNDADFGGPLFGTNLKGYTVGGNLALGPNVWLGLHLMSADSIIGPPFKSDVVQFDLNGKF